MDRVYKDHYKCPYCGSQLEDQNGKLRCPDCGKQFYQYETLYLGKVG